MITNACPNFFTTTETSQVFITGNILPVQSGNLTKWITSRLDTNFVSDDVINISTNMINMGRFDLAVDFMLKEVYDYSKILSKTFNIVFEDRTDISRLMEDLNRDGIIKEEELDRLTVIEMALDGIDMEVNECGGKIETRELTYLQEFLIAVRDILLRKNIYVGLAISSAFSSNSFFVQETISNSVGEEFTTTTGITIVSPSIYCLATYSEPARIINSPTTL